MFWRLATGAWLGWASTAWAAPELPPTALATGAAAPAGRHAAPAVARHDTVQVLVRAGAVQLQLPGRALADGAVGALVRVLNPASRQVFDARVLGAGQVLAIDGGAR